ncbi:anti-sigma F factor antagonist [Clostridium kluyveri]|uniref:Anti-sigma F factor antagonist n=1 Tax=Clostridium kluyveri TaxID=1534 RepID=A0A1L5FBM1_CLOKL|nr:anti-sigma F factor antagonist [Clostridium kluyveri]APM40399.1 anti-sigma F factor antagonist [Clostridium kluyveri]UZQ49348.1 anti-sigma F factor antagonist [Clostridium kluyveri]
MNLQFYVKEDNLIAIMEGELDHHSTEEVRNKIDNQLDVEGINKLILDFSQVSFMDSSGIGVVIGRYKRLNAKKGKICIVGVSPSVRRVFELSGMFKIIGLYDNIEEAIQNI